MSPREANVTTSPSSATTKASTTFVIMPDPDHPHSLTSMPKKKDEDSSSQGFYLRWSRLEKSVQIDRNKDAGLMRSSIGDNRAKSTTTTTTMQPLPKMILDGVSGYAAPGEILAVMGPSGSGKTTLLNCLSGRAKLQSGAIAIAQDVVVTEEPALMKRLMAKIAYVQQADIFFGHLTVREQLTYTALLRLPTTTNTATTTKDEMIAEKVQSILQLLRLNKVADSPIQDCSGGEKKRVNIGTELLTQPPILFLDEPTSGLDSTNAIGLLRLLQRLAQQSQTTIITTIHQPSSSVFFSFDRLLLLSEGKVVYFGTPLESLTYLRNLDLPCPDGYNASDHWMDLLVHDDDDDDVHEKFQQQKNHYHDNNDVNNSDTEQQYPWQQSSNKTTISLRRQKLEQAWDNEALAKEMDQFMNPTKDPCNMPKEPSSKPQRQLTSMDAREFLMGKKYNSSWPRQYFILTHRALRNSRSAIFTPLNLCKSLAIGLVAGVLWFQTEYTEQNINNIRSYYFFTMTFWVFDAMFTSLTAFPAERKVILKERASGSYRLSAYFMAKTTADAPVRLILPFIYMIVSFWMAGISYSVKVFCGTIGCTLLSVLSGEAIGLFVGAAVYDLQKGLTVMTVFTLFLMLLGGFFVENIPVFIAWGKYLSPFKYAFDSSLQLVFDRSMPCDGSGALQELCQNNPSGEVSVEEIRSFMEIQGTIAFNVGMLLILCFVPRYFAYVALRRKKGGERS